MSSFEKRLSASLRSLKFDIDNQLQVSLSFSFCSQFERSRFNHNFLCDIITKKFASLMLSL